MAYEEIAKIAADRVAVVDGPGTIEEVHAGSNRRRCVQAKALLEATEHQPRARVALGAAITAGPSHAYLLRGPRGVGKRAAARAFAAEIIAADAADPDDARRRVLLDPSPHPDLRLARPTRLPAPGRRGARAGDPRFLLPALRRRQAGLRH